MAARLVRSRVHRTAHHARHQGRCERAASRQEAARGIRAPPWPSSIPRCVPDSRAVRLGLRARLVRPPIQFRGSARYEMAPRAAIPRNRAKGSGTACGDVGPRPTRGSRVTAGTRTTRAGRLSCNALCAFPVTRPCGRERAPPGSPARGPVRTADYVCAHRSGVDPGGSGRFREIPGRVNRAVPRDPAQSRAIPRDPAQSREGPRGLAKSRASPRVRDLRDYRAARAGDWDTWGGQSDCEHPPGAMAIALRCRTQRNGVTRDFAVFTAKRRRTPRSAARSLRDGHVTATDRYATAGDSPSANQRKAAETSGDQRKPAEISGLWRRVTSCRRGPHAPLSRPAGERRPANLPTRRPSDEEPGDHPEAPTQRCSGAPTRR